ncbi:MAG TPA: HNH endonuclease [Anaerolineae bacterium]|nr:HNH endonuclease [Phycisphaerae bacterium]HUW11195.1 HNH endonuclease [Anaerolineae bacterium]
MKFASTALQCYNHRVDEKTKDRIVKMFDAGSPLAEIAEDVGYCVPRMTQILQERGHSAWKRRYPNQDDWDWEAIFADYQNQMPFEDLLRKHKVSCTTFHRHRVAEGVPLRPRLGAPGKQNYQYKNGNNAENRKLNRRYGYIARQIAAQCLDHAVPKGWNVHHMDENPANNDPANLALFPGKSEHAKYHQQLLRCQREGFPADASQLVSENGGFLLPLPTHPIVFPRKRGRPSLRRSQQKPKQDQPASEPG